jgi:hypothetical protein
LFAFPKKKQIQSNLIILFFSLSNVEQNKKKVIPAPIFITKRMAKFNLNETGEEHFNFSNTIALLMT